MTGVRCTFEMCLRGLHESCIRYGPPPNTAGGTRVVCDCPCHSGGQDPDWKPSDADRMATYFAFEHGTDPRVDQIVEGKFPDGIHCSHGYPPGECCPVCGEIPVDYDDSDDVCPACLGDTTTDSYCGDCREFV